MDGHSTTHPPGTERSSPFCRTSRDILVQCGRNVARIYGTRYHWRVRRQGGTLLGAMPKALSRWGRVGLRILLAYKTLQGNGKIVFAIASLLGISYTFLYEELNAWFAQNSAHRVIVGLVVLLILVLLALSGAEKEREQNDKTIVQLSVLKVASEFRPLLHFNEGTKYNILITEVDVRFRNTTKDTTRAFIPEIKLLWQSSRREWRELSVEAIDSTSLSGESFSRGLPGRTEPWYPDQRVKIPALDDVVGRFKIEGVIPAHDLRLLKGSLKIRLTIDVVGHSGPVVLEHALPKVDMEAFA